MDRQTRSRGSERPRSRRDCVARHCARACATWLLIGVGDVDAQSAPDAGATGVRWDPFVPTKATSSGGATLTLGADGTIVVANAPDKDTITLEGSIDRRGVNAIRIEAFADASLPAQGPGCADNGNFMLGELQVAQAPKNSDRFTPVTLEHATADFEQTGWPAVAAVDGVPGTGWAIWPLAGQPHEAIFEAVNLGFEAGAKLRITLDFPLGGKHELGRFRLSTTTAPKPLRVERDLSGVAEAQGRIPAAIERGVRWLLDQQELDGSWSYAQPQFHHGTTALACYTLIKCGLRKSHPAIVRSLDFMATQLPTGTYEAGLELLARAAMEDDGELPQMQSIVDRLLSWQVGGGWSYPSTKPDLSNTQYAAMGLRAAALRGAKIPIDVWTRLGEETLLHQEKASGAYEPAGFGYYAGGPAYGSITAGGTCVLQICHEQLEKAGAPRAAFSAAVKRGLTWLDRQFAPTINPKGDATWIWYWLYGVERVGGLCQVEELAGRSWYREGASHIVGSQKPEGSWDGGAGPQPSTCFALLFLARATSSVSGVPHRGENLYGGDDPASDVSVRASGDTPLAVWISSFGEKPRAELAWPEDGGNGLRVARVDYVLPVRALLADSRSDAGSWRFTTEAPTGGWELTAFDDRKWRSGPGSFGRPGTSGTAVRTEWSSDQLWLRREFTIDDSPLVAPTLRVLFSARAPSADDEGTHALVCLFDEEPAFADLVNEGAPATIRAVEKDAYQGNWSLAVTPPQRFRAAMPGWGLSIAEKPRPGEFRFLRFAWRKEGAGGIMMQLAQDGAWGAKTRRVVAGPNELKWAATEIAREPPRRWTLVTVDLWKEFGANGILTGIAFTPMSGTGFFDAIYLARSLEDFKAPPKAGSAPAAPTAATPAQPGSPPTASGPAAALAFAAPGEGPALDVFLNGTRVFATSDEIADAADVPTVAPLAALLVPGRNVIAAQARRIGLGQAVDLAIVDQRVVASVAGDGAAPCGANRFPAQLTFERNGSYPLHARVSVASPNGERTLESPPLAITIREALDLELLSYAKDPSRNLIALAGASATASSALDAGWLPQRAIDNYAATGWLSADLDRRPSLTIEMTKPVRADTVLVTPIQLRGGDAERATFRVRRVQVLVDQGRSGTFEITMPEDFRKGVARFPKPTVVRRLDVRILDATGVPPAKPALGLGEVELQLRK